MSDLMQCIKKIGILGGTFDPIHTGHLLLAEAAINYFQLDEVLFIPSGNSYMKDNVTDKNLRADMVALAIQDNPMFRLSYMEVNRNGNSYSYETICALKKKYPQNKYYFIVGADSVFSIQSWKCIDLLMQNCIIAVAVRMGHSIREVEKKIMELQQRYQCEIQLFNTLRIDISSTDIRDRIKKKQTIRYMVPDQLLKYLSQNDIYEVTK